MDAHSSSIQAIHKHPDEAIIIADNGDVLLVAAVIVLG
jgi:hypothetical protein